MRSVEVSLPDQGRACRSAHGVPRTSSPYPPSGSLDDHWSTRGLLTTLLARIELLEAGHLFNLIPPKVTGHN